MSRGMNKKGVKEEKYQYGGRSFVFKTFPRRDGWHVIITDDLTRKRLNLTGTCRYEVCQEIIARDPSRDPLKELVDALQSGIRQWVDRKLI